MPQLQWIKKMKMASLTKSKHITTAGIIIFKPIRVSIYKLLNSINL